MKNLTNLENKITQAEQRANVQKWTVIRPGDAELGQDETKHYTADGKEYTGDIDAENVIRIIYDKNWGQK